MVKMKETLEALLRGRRGHFQMESGYHANAWYELGRLFDQPGQLSPFVQELARRLAAYHVEVVCGPMVGGARLAREIAAELKIQSCITERHEDPAATGLFPVRYLVPLEQRESLRGKKVAIVDDAISAGSAVRGSYADLMACGAQPVVIGALFIFGGAATEFASTRQLGCEGIAPLEFNLWKPDECPLCRAGLALEKVSDAEV